MDSDLNKNSVYSLGMRLEKGSARQQLRQIA